MTDKVVALVTSGSLPECEKIATALVEKRLAACVNVVPNIRSFYRWEGKIQDEQEFLMVIKTTRARFSELRAEVERLHSYQVPEIICLPILEGAEPYLRWVEESVRPLEAPDPGRR